MVGAQLHPRRRLPSQSTVSEAEAVIAPNRAARPSKSFFMYDEGISFGKLSVGRFVRRKCTSTFNPPKYLMVVNSFKMLSKKYMIGL